MDDMADIKDGLTFPDLAKAIKLPRTDEAIQEKRRQQIAMALAEVYVRKNLHRLFLENTNRELGNLAQHLKLFGMLNDVTVDELKKFIEPIAARVISQALRPG